MHRIGVFEPEAHPAGRTGPRAGLAGVEQRGQARLLDHLVERIGHPVVGIEPLGGRVELETPDTELLDQTAGFAHAHLSLVRIDRGEGDQDVVVLGGDLGHLLVGDPGDPHLGFGVDVEDHRRHLALAVEGGRLGDGGALGLAEVLGHGLVEQHPARVARLAGRHLRMGVHVDGDEVVEVQVRLVLGHGSSLRRATQL